MREYLKIYADMRISKNMMHGQSIPSLKTNAFLRLSLGVSILLLSVTLPDSTVLQNFCLIKVKQVRNTFSANLPS